MLCQQIHRPEAPDALVKVLSLVDQLVKICTSTDYDTITPDPSDHCIWGD